MSAAFYERSQTRRSAHSRRNVLHHPLQQLEPPPIVDLRRYQPLLYDPQHGRVLARRDHLPRVARKERAQKLHEPGDTTFLLPARRRQQERKEIPVRERHVGCVCFEHLGEELEDVGDVF